MPDKKKYVALAVLFVWLGANALMWNQWSQGGTPLWNFTQEKAVRVFNADDTGGMVMAGEENVPNNPLPKEAVRDLPLENAATATRPTDPASVSPSETASQEPVRVVAVGDIMLSRVVENKMIASKNWQYPFLKTVDLTSGADLTVGNLETTIFPGKPIGVTAMKFRTDPKAVSGLLAAGFDVLTLSNNHIMNYGREGLVSTLNYLNEAQIAHTGAGISESEIAAPVVREVKGVKFGFLSYSYANEKGQNPDGGIYGTNFMDTERMKREVAELRERADVVVVSMHAGVEYKTKSMTAQQAFARAAIDAGAKVVLGHHPHVVQETENYNGGKIIYSLGNFVFDQNWSAETKLGAVAILNFRGANLEKVDYVPVKIIGTQPTPLTGGAEAKKILQRLGA